MVSRLYAAALALALFPAALCQSAPARPTSAQLHPPSGLFAALEAHDEAQFKQLLDNGASPASRDWQNRLILVEATEKGDLEAIRMLLRAGADVNESDRFHRTALIRAADFTRPGSVELLLESGAEVNARDDQGQTALFKAARHQNAGAVRLLLKAGADINLKDHSGQTVLAQESQRNSYEMVALLKHSGAQLGDAQQEMLAAAAQGNVAQLRRMIAAGDDVNTTGDRGMTPLMLAAKTDKPWPSASSSPPKPISMPRTSAVTPRSPTPSAASMKAP